MNSDSINFNYEQCRNEARRALDALHDGLEFIEEETREIKQGWLFRFGIPTGNPDDPWEYLIGCSNEIFINRCTGKVEKISEQEILSDWMDDE